MCPDVEMGNGLIEIIDPNLSLWFRWAEVSFVFLDVFRRLWRSCHIVNVVEFLLFLRTVIERRSGQK